MSLVNQKRVVNIIPANPEVGSIYYVKKDGVVTQWLIQNDGTPIQVIENKPKSWLELLFSALSNTEEAILQNGIVYKLDYGTHVYYRYASNDSDKLQDKIYSDFDGTTLTGIVAERISN